MAHDEPKSIIGWCLYDWANSAFATTIMAGFFPIFFKQFWNTGVDQTVSTARLGVANSLSGIVIVAMAPIIGAIADKASAKKKFLFFFAYLGILSTSALFLVAKGNWILAVVLYVFGSIGFAGGNVFYDALITGVASEDKVDVISATGFGLGYLGGGLLFALNVWMTRQPELFGFVDETQAVRFSFLTVGLWWAVFSIPIFLFVEEPKNAKAASDIHFVKAGFRQIWHTLQEIRHLKSIFLFLAAYWLYIDGVDTIIRMAVDYGMAVGFDYKDLIVALLLVQFVGFPAAVGFGYLGKRIGTKRAIFIAIGMYLCISLWAAFMREKHEFYIMAVMIGLVQGGIQALSRSYYARIIPPDRSAEYFGFYNMLGKFAAVIGPVLMGGVGLLVKAMGYSSNFASRMSIVSISILFLAGGALFYFVDEQQAKQEQQRLSLPG